LAVAVSACGLHTLSGSRQSVRVAAVKGQSLDDALATLQNQGFKVRTQQKPDSAVAAGQVIDTRPPAGEAAQPGSEVVVNVSTGPELRTIPDVSNRSFAEARNILTAAGFGTIKQVPTPSTPEQKDRVLGTVPAADQTAPVTSEVSVLVGSGPAP
jgi:serine/threonine-protein kinase